MKTLRIDSVGGASGDMLLAALLDTGLSLPSLRKALATLSLEPFTIRRRRDADRGHTGTRVTVSVPHAHHHAEHGHAHHHPHRTFKTIRAMIRRAGLPPAVKALSIAVFERLAVAEGRVHGMSPDTVHFHEVGAVDSIVDIVGACFLLHELGIEHVTIGPLPIGTGTVKCAHGVMPVPVPATVELLAGHDIVQTTERGEMVTPTGAALLVTWRDMAAAPPTGPLRVTRHGVGLGHRQFSDRPNLLHATVLETVSAGDATNDECLVLECNLDDMTPELIGGLTTRLLEAGALDVFTTAVMMKKQRPGVLLTILAALGDREPLIELLFLESTTFGVRESLTRRTMLARRIVKVRTRYGVVRVKEGTWKGRAVTRSPEYDDCTRLAERAGVAVRDIYAAAARC